MTVKEALKVVGISNKDVELVCLTRGFDSGQVATYDFVSSKEYQLAKADILVLRATNPNISEGGVSISQSEKALLINLANKIYRNFGEPLVSLSNSTVTHINQW